MGKEISSEFKIGYIAPGEVGAFVSMFWKDRKTALNLPIFSRNAQSFLEREKK